MRDKLNNNPMAQAGVIGILILVAAFFFLSGMGGGGSSATPAAAPADATATAPADPAAATAAATTGTATAGTAATSVTTPIPARPLPPPVKTAYDAGGTVVLLVHGSGIDDRLVTRTVRSLSSIGGVSVFTVPVREIAHYSAITLGVNVERVPALIVVRPRGLSGGTPQASVSYGFQSPAAIVQEVHDASYSGPGSSYQPN
jgi:hypothetical protein